MRLPLLIISLIKPMDDERKWILSYKETGKKQPHLFLSFPFGSKLMQNLNSREVATWQSAMNRSPNSACLLIRNIPWWITSRWQMMVINLSRGRWATVCSWGGGRRDVVLDRIYCCRRSIIPSLRHRVSFISCILSPLIRRRWSVSLFSLIIRLLKTAKPIFWCILTFSSRSLKNNKLQIVFKYHLSNLYMFIKKYLWKSCCGSKSYQAMVFCSRTRCPLHQHTCCGWRNWMWQTTCMANTRHTRYSRRTIEFLM
jgi:hypothetical protein